MTEELTCQNACRVVFFEIEELMVKGSHGAAGFDMRLSSDLEIAPGNTYVCTNFYSDDRLKFTTVEPRSGLSFKKGLQISHSTRAASKIVCDKDGAMYGFMLNFKVYRGNVYEPFTGKYLRIINGTTTTTTTTTTTNTKNNTQNRKDNKKQKRRKDKEKKK